MLVEIVRRAAYDWVLYKDSKDRINKSYADEAYEWLFVEEEGDEVWEERVATGTVSTSFLSICDALDLNPDMIRKGITLLTSHRIKTLGRIPSSRKMNSNMWGESGEGSDVSVGVPAELLIEYDTLDVVDDGTRYVLGFGSEDQWDTQKTKSG
ncbi:MAG: hypothetical protein ACXABY_13425 [Candidatus Thorarchaeota archaeon]|jgi:hypothetical protein